MERCSQSRAVGIVKLTVFDLTRIPIITMISWLDDIPMGTAQRRRFTVRVKVRGRVGHDEAVNHLWLSTGPTAAVTCKLSDLINNILIE